MSILVLIMILLLGNTLLFAMNEEYRFFLKKLKYSDEIVYDQGLILDDSEIAIGDTDQQEQEKSPSTSIEAIEEETITFFEALTERQGATQEEELGELTQEEKRVREILEQRFILRKVETDGILFDLTEEYPDLYHEYENNHFNFYIFSTEDYEGVRDIFTVLSYELPYSLNEVNNFGSASFFINLDEDVSDDMVRLVFEYEKKAFGLKIKKDMYNQVKELLGEL